MNLLCKLEATEDIKFATVDDFDQLIADGKLRVIVGDAATARFCMETFVATFAPSAINFDTATKQIEFFE